MWHPHTYSASQKWKIVAQGNKNHYPKLFKYVQIFPTSEKQIFNYELPNRL